MAHDHNKYTTGELAYIANQAANVLADDYALDQKIEALALTIQNGGDITSSVDQFILSQAFDDAFIDDNLPKFKALWSKGFRPWHFSENEQSAKNLGFLTFGILCHAPQCASYYLERLTIEHIALKTENLKENFERFLSLAISSSSPEVVEVLLNYAKTHNIEYSKKYMVGIALNHDIRIEVQLLEAEPKPILDKILSHGFSPYTKDNLRMDTTEQSIIFKAAFDIYLENGEDTEVEFYTSLISHMNDPSEIEKEKNYFIECFKNSYADDKVIRDKVVHLLEQRALSLREKYMLETATAHIKSSLKIMGPDLFSAIDKNQSVLKKNKI